MKVKVMSLLNILGSRIWHSIGTIRAGMWTSYTNFIKPNRFSRGHNRVNLCIVMLTLWESAKQLSKVCEGPKRKGLMAGIVFPKLFNA